MTTILTDAEREALQDDEYGGINANLQFLIIDAAHGDTTIDGATLTWRKDSIEDCDGEDRDWWTLWVEHRRFSIKGSRTEELDVYNIYDDENAAVEWLRRNFAQDWAEAVA